VPSESVWVNKRIAILKKATHASSRTDGISGLIRTLIKYKGLLIELSSREVKDRYINHSLGGIWTFLSPLLMCGLYVYLFSEIFPARLGGDFQGPKSLIWLLSGLTVWFVITDVMGRALSSISGASSLVKQVIFPVEILPAQVVVTAVPTFAVGLIVVLCLVAWASPAVLVGALWMLPLALILLTAVCVGLAYFLAALCPFMRDLREIITFFSGAGMFLAPILYFPPTIENINPFMKAILSGNPFTHLVACFRDALFYGSMTQPVSWAIATVFACLLVYFGFTIFQRLKSHFSEAI
jgi:lipopolysaccharide transport system permease protein